MTNEQLAIILNNIHSELQKTRAIMEYDLSQDNFDNFYKYKRSVSDLEEKIYEYIQILIGK